MKYLEIVITGRTKHFLSLCGEHLSVDNMTTAIREVSERFNIRSQEFCVTGEKLSEGFAHQWYVGTDQDVDLAAFTMALDDKLKEVNDDYRTERDFALKEIRVKLLPNQVFVQYLDQLGKQGAQVKFPRVLKGAQAENWRQYLSQNNF